MTIDYMGQVGSRKTSWKTTEILLCGDDFGLFQVTAEDVEFWIQLEGRTNRICDRLHIGSERKRGVKMTNLGLTNWRDGVVITELEKVQEP